MHSFQSVLQQHPAAGLQRAEHTTVLAMGVAGLQAAEAEGLQVAEVVLAALDPGHDVVHLQGPLMRGLLTNSPPRSIRSGPWQGGAPGL
jgi:hypothetical protein